MTPPPAAGGGGGLRLLRHRGGRGARRGRVRGRALARLPRPPPALPRPRAADPAAHAARLADLPPEDAGPLFGRARLLAQALPEAPDAEGAFVAINDGVSRSAPHLHVHVVPRRRGDGLRGFFWPRRPCENGGRRGAPGRREAARTGGVA